MARSERDFEWEIVIGVRKIDREVERPPSGDLSHTDEIAIEAALSLV